MNAEELTIEFGNLKKEHDAFGQRLTAVERKADDAYQKISKVGDQVEDLSQKVSNLEKSQAGMAKVLDKIDKRTLSIEQKNAKTKRAIIISLVCAVGAFVFMALQSAEAAAAVAGLAAKLLVV